MDPTRLEARDLHESGERGVYFRMGTIVGWPSSRKCLLVAGCVLVLVCHATFLLHAARQSLEHLPFLDPEVLEKQISFSYVTLAAWCILLLGSGFASWRDSESPFFDYAPIQLYAITNSIFAYLFGYFTDPYGFVTLVGGIMVALPLFGPLATRAGVISWLLVFAVLVFLEQRGEIAYAPLYLSSPTVDGTLSSFWALGMGSINVTGALLATVLGFSAFGQLRRRDKLLWRKQVELLSTVQVLNQTTDELEEGRRELELRVDARTRELKASNRNLHFEIEQRERTVAELNDMRQAMEAAIEGVARVSAGGRILSANAAFLSMHAAPNSAMLGSPADSWVVVDDRGRIEEALNGLRSSQKAELDLEGLRPDGTRFPQLLVLVKVAGGKSGEHYRFARDVTRQAELSEQLNHSMKMEAVGRLAGGIAHDFNNLLMAILAGSERLQSIFRASSPEGEELEMADMITMAGTRAGVLTSQLLEFAHLQPSKTSKLEVNQSVNNMLELVAPALDQSVEVEIELCERSLFAMGDASRFDSGLLNLALNAKDAMPEGGRLAVTTCEVRLDRDEAALVGVESRPSGYARIDVIDNGLGMDSATRSKVFDAFFTTKPAGKGTGLGLSVFNTYILEVGGAIKFTSTPGRGTTCSVFVPLIEPSVQQDAAASSAQVVKGSETVLLAEDEDIVARATTMLLSNSGYQVIRCATGLEAVKLYRERGDEIDLVLLDFRMPEMNGAQAFRELRQINPDVQIILMSGNLSLPEFKELKADGLRSILRKPCSRAELNAAIREALEDNRTSG